MKIIKKLKGNIFLLMIGAVFLKPYLNLSKCIGCISFLCVSLLCLSAQALSPARASYDLLLTEFSKNPPAYQFLLAEDYSDIFFDIDGTVYSKKDPIIPPVLARKK